MPSVNHLSKPTKRMDLPGGIHSSDALPWLMEANRLARRVCDDELIAGNLSNIGFSHAHLQKTIEAVESYREALAAYRRLGIKEREADLLKRLALLAPESRN